MLLIWIYIRKEPPFHKDSKPFSAPELYKTLQEILHKWVGSYMKYIYDCSSLETFIDLYVIGPEVSDKHGTMTDPKTTTFHVKSSYVWQSLQTCFDNALKKVLFVSS